MDIDAKLDLLYGFGSAVRATIGGLGLVEEVIALSRVGKKMSQSGANDALQQALVLKDALDIGDGRPTALMFDMSFGVQAFLGAAAHSVQVGTPSFKIVDGGNQA